MWDQKFYHNSEDDLAGEVGSDDEGAEGRRVALEEMNVIKPENGSSSEGEDQDEDSSDLRVDLQLYSVLVTSSELEGEKTRSKIVLS
ncbi:hypothetical protein K438DRAFT_2001648 [Mycena galopus ATCC 62051]|nr:hypothetical protein K438DRAFT_2001648 [Mycena galopus ATCC 62051]